MSFSVSGLALSVTFGDTSPKGRGFGKFPQGLGEPPEAPPKGELAKPIGFD